MNVLVLQQTAPLLAEEAHNYFPSNHYHIAIIGGMLDDVRMYIYVYIYIDGYSWYVQEYHLPYFAPSKWSIGLVMGYPNSSFR